MKKWAVGGAMVCSVALGLAGGCSDDETTATPAGTPSSVSAGGSGGQGGQGGQADECTACTTSSCGPVLQGCQDDPECATWLQCIQACTDSACIDDCDQAAIGFAALHLVYGCMCNSCATECAAVDPCERQCNAGAPPVLGMNPPATLAETGLYVGVGDPDGAQIASYAESFEPRYVLWSDGATKRRWAYIPACEKIDTTDFDHWDFPVGTRFWKEFTRDGVLIETRIIYRFGPDSMDWQFATYQWDAAMGNMMDPTTAALTMGAVIDANGTGHDIPAAPGDCVQCHGKLVERALGFSAVQLTHSIMGSVNLAALSDGERLTMPAPAGGFPVPGNSNVETDALGYLHANCGNCHNDAMAVPDMRLRILTGDTSVMDTDTFTTAVNVLTTNWMAGPGKYRIPGGTSSFAAGCVIERIQGSSMPPLASEIPDATGAGLIAAWAQTLPAPM